jgi:hypothetical protein
MTQAGDNAATTADAFIALLKRRKILWELHLGTVGPSVSGDPTLIINSTQTQVTLDGDTGIITARSLVDTLLTGARVAVIFVPPAGYYIIGVLGAPMTVGTTVYFENLNTTFTTSASSVEQVVYTTLGSVTFETGNAYFIEVWAQIHSVTTASNPSANVREGSLTGTILAAGPRIALAAANLDDRFDRHGYVVNTTGQEIIQPLVVTVTPNGVACVWAGIVTSNMYIRVAYVGPSSAFPGAIALT